MGHSPTGCKELDTTERLREILPGKRNILGQSENGITIIIWFFLKKTNNYVKIEKGDYR